METNLNHYFKSSWISASLLAPPNTKNGKLLKGALILNQVAPVLELYPTLQNLFFIIERRGWHGANEKTPADIKLVEDLSAWEETKSNSPEAFLLDIGPADFVDHSYFKPINNAPQHDAIQVSCWSPRKRIELFIEAAAKLPHRSFVHLGHFEHNGTPEELIYRNNCLDLAKAITKNIYFPFQNHDQNELLPTTKAEMNLWINQAKIGVLTTTSEGINRFKMECLSANRPCLIPNDVNLTTQKHINNDTGVLYAPDADELAKTIEKTLLTQEKFSPRTYILANTGKTLSLLKLKNALRELCKIYNQEFHLESIDWDGRNESLSWGNDAITLLDALMSQYRHLLK